MASECAWAEVVQRRRVDGIGVCASGGWSAVAAGWLAEEEVTLLKEFFSNAGRIWMEVAGLRWWVWV
jgi:hypothetical protein